MPSERLDIRQGGEKVNEMSGMKHLQKIREYCDYLEEHLLNVEKAWKTLQAACADMAVIWDDFLYFQTDFMIQEHDISKMSTAEFIPYQRNFFPVGEKDDTGFDAAWEHHLGHNPHHWEAWAKRHENFPNENACHCFCMVCDWMAMGMKFGDTAEEYYTKHRDEIEIPEWARTIVGEIFDRLRKVDPPSKGL